MFNLRRVTGSTRTTVSFRQGPDSARVRADSGPGRRRAESGPRLKETVVLVEPWVEL